MMSHQCHSICLKPICRLCGLKRAIPNDRCPYVKEKYEKLIKSAVNVDVSADVTGIHPPFICQCCFLKMKRWKKTANNHCRKMCNIIVVAFNDVECDLCSVSDVAITLEDYKKEAAKSCLIPWLVGGTELQLIKLSKTGDVITKLTVFENFTWKITVAGVAMQTNLILGEDFSPILKVEDCGRLCDLVASAGTCIGNVDFPDLVERKKGPDGQIPLKVTANDTYCSVFNTIRHVKCELLVPKDVERCMVCKVYRSDLAAIRSASRAEPTGVLNSISSTVPNKCLSRMELEEKAANLQADRRRLKRRSGCLQDKIAKLYERESAQLLPAESALLEDAFKEGGPEIENMLPPNSASRLLWEQQQEAFKKGKGMRWHPAIIRWCIAVQNRSQSAYNLLRETGFLKLPHPNTLRPYTNFTDVASGFCPDLLDRIALDLDLQEPANELKRHVSLLFDEMKVKSGLYFSVSSGKMVGFTDMGSLNNEIHSFERRCNGEAEPPTATHVLVLMLRGIFSNLHAPVAFYPTTTASSCDLFMSIWEAVELIEVAGFQVHAFVSDGASPNRKFYRLHCAPNFKSDLTYKTQHPLDPTRSVYFFCDVPHLVKTIRNNLENSGYHNKTRHLHCNKQDIKWKHFMDVYDWDVEVNKSCPGLRFLHKFTYEHLHLTPSLRMRVYMAAQVLSSSVANAMEVMGRYDMKTTIKFVRLVDQFFDCLNVSNLFSGKRSRKPALEPYKTETDWRFKWLHDEFLGFFREWEEEVNRLVGVEKSEKKKMLLSTETLEGLRITVHSFVELTKNLLSCPGVEYVLSEKFNQDPLEQYFSKQRGAGGHNSNPTVFQFGHNMNALYVASSCARASKRGNCRRPCDDAEPIDNTPLPRRKSSQM